MFRSFISDIFAGDPMALLIVAIVLAIIVWLYPTEKSRAKDEADTWVHRASTALSKLLSRNADGGIHPEAIVSINISEATSRIQIAQEEARARIQLALERERRDIGLDGGQRAELKAFYSLEEIKNRLFKIYDDWDRLEKGTEPDNVKRQKIAVLKQQAALFEDDFYARAKQVLVSVDDGPRLRDADQDTDRPGSSEQGAQANTDPASPERTRVGF